MKKILSMGILLMSLPSLGEDLNGKDIYTKPSLIPSSCSKPSYPAESLLAREEGITQLQLNISQYGKSIDSKVEISSGFSGLDSAAIVFFEGCKYNPAKKNGKPVAGIFQIRYRWKIE